MIDNRTTEALVQKAIAGGQSAMKALYDSYGKLMYHISLRMTARKEDAEDIVQESFIKAFKSLHQLKDHSTFGGWLRQIVIHNCIEHAKKKTPLTFLTDRFEEREEEDPAWLEENSYAAIHEAIKNLPEGCRQIFLLYVLEDYKHKEIAGFLGVSESTSKSQYLRAKQLLQQSLKKVRWIK